ncbi:ssrA-binding protein [Tasmannia lanceolata]|uniref:ssrA-binding protein n=1 Tax=Tasmannia lanceolata TaxID=3420 RepID=UPI004063638B
MASWVRTITSPFRKACTFFNLPKEKKSQAEKEEQKEWFFLWFDLAGHDPPGMDLHGEVMACGYEDVRVMWSILDKSKPRLCDVGS